MSITLRPARIRRLLPVLVPAIVLAACGGAAGSPSIAPTVATTAAASMAASPVATRAATPFPVDAGTPLGDRLVATVTVDKAPCALAVDGASVWVTSNATGELDRIDPTTNKVADRITLDTGPCGIAVGSDGRIWVAELGAVGAVVAVDPTTRKITGRLDGVGPQLWDLKAGFGAIWVADRSARTVLRIEPTTAKVTATIAVGPQPSGLAVLPEGVWVSDDSDGKVRRIDPKTNTVVATVDVGGAPSWFADDGLANLVVAQRGAGKVIALDPMTGAGGTPIGGWNVPLDGTVVQGKAWIPEGGGRRVGVVGLAAGGAEPVRYALPGALNPFVAEPGFGDVWVLDFGATTIWRIRP